MFPLWRHVLNVFGVEITETVGLGYVNVHISEMDFFGEGFIVEGGKVVGKAAVLDVEEHRLEYTKGPRPGGYLRISSHTFFVVLTFIAA